MPVNWSYVGSLAGKAAKANSIGSAVGSGMGSGTSVGSSRSSSGSSGGSRSSSSGGSRSSSGGGSSSGKSSAQIQAEEQQKAAEEARKALQAQIDSEYSNINNTLNNQESSLNAQLPITEGQINQSYGEVLPSLNLEESTKVSGLEGQAAAGQQATTGTLNTARKTYNELLSGANKFGGSAGQAYGELLGRSTAETIGIAKNNLATFLNQVNGEITNVKTFYAQKKTDLKKAAALAVEKARQDVRDQVATINANRTAAANWKANQNLQAMATFQQTIANIKTAAAQAQEALDQWTAEKNAALQASAQKTVKQYTMDPTNLSKLGLSVAPEGMSSYMDYLNGGQDWNNVQGLYSTKKSTTNTGQSSVAEDPELQKLIYGE